MTNTFKDLGRGLALTAAACCALALTGCATHPQAPRLSRAAAAQPNARLAAPHDAALAAEASAFESFMRHARGIAPDFSGPSDVAQALQTGAGHEPHQLESGMIA